MSIRYSILSSCLNEGRKKKREWPVRLFTRIAEPVAYPYLPYHTSSTILPLPFLLYHTSSTIPPPPYHPCHTKTILYPYFYYTVPYLYHAVPVWCPLCTILKKLYYTVPYLYFSVPTCTMPVPCLSCSVAGGLRSFARLQRPSGSPVIKTNLHLPMQIPGSHHYHCYHHHH